MPKPIILIIGSLVVLLIAACGMSGPSDAQALQAVANDKQDAIATARQSAAQSQAGGAGDMPGLMLFAGPAQD